jgi:hypothetical protein
MLEVRASNVVMVTAVARVVCARGVAARTVRFGKGVNTEQSAKIQNAQALRPHNLLRPRDSVRPLDGNSSSQKEAHPPAAAALA